ncbi:MAG: hypothetical protein J6J36_07060 [Clostridia bacterium]|nr:hypothetical protein [Clostridia bacterium]
MTLEEKLHRIIEKENEIKNLQYDIVAIKRDCLETYKNFMLNYGELCSLINLTEAFHSYKDAEVEENEYNKLVKWLTQDLFNTIPDAKIEIENISACGWSIYSLWIIFKVTIFGQTKTFRLEIPNAPMVQTFEEITTYGIYEETSENCWEGLYHTYKWNELKKNFGKVIMEHIGVTLFGNGGNY